MSNFETPFKKPEFKSSTAYTEIEVRVVITDIEKKLDKNQKDYWVIRTQQDQWTKKSYLAFSQDFNLSAKTKTLLINYPEKLVNHWATLTIKKRNEREIVIHLELEKY